MQSQRLRMVSDSELRLEQFQAERKDEKRRYEDALERLKQVACPALPHRTLFRLLCWREPTNASFPSCAITEAQSCQSAAKRRIV